MKLYGLANESHSALRTRGSQVAIVLASDKDDAKMKFRMHGFSTEIIEKYNIVEVSISIGDNPVNCFLY